MVFYLLTSLVLFQLWYWWFYYFYSFKKYQVPQENRDPWPPVSIVICFKGLPQDYEANLDRIISQNYPEFELVLVDDFNNLVDVNTVKSWQQSHPDKAIKVIPATKDLPGKKHALITGLVTCQHELVLLTDIDCYPDSPLWVQKMTGNLLNYESDIVLGYGPMSKGKGWVAWFSAFETTLTAMQYFGHFFAGRPYMSVGRNWMIRKSIYLKAWELSKGKNLASGDDDLVFQAALPHAKVSACLEKESYVYSKPKSTWNALIRQKIRHITTAVVYPLYVQTILFLFALTFPLFYGLLTYLFIVGEITWFVFISIALVKWSLQTILHYSIIKKLDDANFLITYPLGEVVLSVYYPILSFAKFFFSEKW